MFKVTATVVTYNNASIIAGCIRSLFEFNAQAGLTLFVADNASTDGTVEVVTENFGGLIRDGKIVIIQNARNIGFGRANNKVIPFLKSGGAAHFHVVLNPDIRITYDVIGQLCEVLESEPDVVCAVPKFVCADGKEQLTPKRRPTLLRMMSGRLSAYSGTFAKIRREYCTPYEELQKGRGVYRTDFCSGCFMFMRTEAFLKAGGFDERYFLYSEDADLTRELQKYGRTVYVRDAVTTHDWGRGYNSSLKLFLVQIGSMFKYFIKWHGRQT